ncbi:HAD family hydrolase [Paenibacillus polymyxa]|jgi:beta-phosphoglucomutase family hydrolase|uniref:HAD family hydrolase n=1 Tax=unclassified Paenibacillus TaxID=185978 RepID=UPI00088C069A|nr:HAD family hydrolase [Paenibacillus sp. CF095]SDC46201.1 haloacid dehalogenase superfamily, subfamily IA, variant 3 with third motif having DD or ED/beta-phosphoglucomutase family hydrolase [Paenibacillus sp. CF095]
MAANKESNGLGAPNDDIIQAVIFDMDGVLIDSEPIYFEIERSSFTHFGARVTDEEHHTYVGVTLESMWQQVLDKHQLTATLEEIFAYHQHNVMQTMLAHPNLTAMPSVERWLSWLHEQHVPIAVASSSPRALIDLIMDKTGLGQYFEVRMTGEEVTNGKPAPDIFLTTAEMIGASPSNCLVIEDSRNGVQAAKSAGMRCIGYRNPGSGNQDLSKADLQISSYDELWTLKDTLPFEGRLPSLSKFR